MFAGYSAPGTESTRLELLAARGFNPGLEMRSPPARAGAGRGLSAALRPKDAGLIEWSTFKVQPNTFEAEQNTFEAQRNVSPLVAGRAASARRIGVSTMGMYRICQTGVSTLGHDGMCQSDRGFKPGSEKHSDTRIAGTCKDAR